VRSGSSALFFSTNGRLYTASSCAASCTSSSTPVCRGYLYSAIDTSVCTLRLFLKAQIVRNLWRRSGSMSSRSPSKAEGLFRCSMTVGRLLPPSFKSVVKASMSYRCRPMKSRNELCNTEPCTVNAMLSVSISSAYSEARVRLPCSFQYFARSERYTSGEGKATTPSYCFPTSSNVRQSGMR
jgi:hypothetical protein